MIVRHSWQTIDITFFVDLLLRYRNILHNTSSGKTRAIESDSDILDFLVKPFDLPFVLGMAPVWLEIDSNLGSVL